MLFGFLRVNFLPHISFPLSLSILFNHLPVYRPNILFVRKQISYNLGYPEPLGLQDPGQCNPAFGMVSTGSSQCFSTHFEFFQKHEAQVAGPGGLEQFVSGVRDKIAVYFHELWTAAKKIKEKGVIKPVQVFSILVGISQTLIL